MRQVENAPAVRPLLERQALAAVALAIQVVVPDEHHVARFGAALRMHRRYARGSLSQCQTATRDVQGIAHGRVFYAPPSPKASAQQALKGSPLLPIAFVSVMPVVPHSDNARPMVHIARQAILDARGHVVGYELLYRGSVRDTACTVEGDVAGASVLTGAVLDLRLDALTDGRTAFINITRSMLLNGVATLLRPSLALFELREDISIDAEVIDACRTLSESGYRLALDDFVPGSAAEVLLPYVSHVKVDTLALSRETVAGLAQRLASSGITLIAEKVETRDVFEWSRDAGCGLFQGHYFRRPEMRSGGVVPARQASHLRLLAALNDPALTTDRLEDLVKQDAALSLRVLQCINSAAFPTPARGAIDRRSAGPARRGSDPQVGLSLVPVEAECRRDVGAGDDRAAARAGV